METWKDIVGFEGLYQISSLGNVLIIKRRKYIAFRRLPNGYLQVALSKNNKKKYLYVHRLVAMGFIPNPENKPEINHVDTIKTHNWVENLEWSTRSENALHAADNKLLDKSPLRARRKIAQYGLDNKLIKVWGSLSEIKRKLGFMHGAIRACCLGERNKSKGFIWRFVEDPDPFKK